MRLAGQAKGGFYPTPERVVQQIAKFLRPDKARYQAHSFHNLIDPCCGNGDALRDISAHLRNTVNTDLTSYGVELHKDRAAQAGEFLDHTLGLDIFQTSIANNAFGLLYLNPPYDFDSDTESKRRLEHSFLTYCTRYLQPNGILVFVIPQIRLSVSANYIASHYHNIRCYSFPKPEWEDFNQVVLFAARNTQPAPNPSRAREIMDWSMKPIDPLSKNSYAIYSIPPSTATDLLFANRLIDPQESANIARVSGLWTHSQVQEALWPPAKRTTRPLMPLRRGHMAMLIAAGLMDNISLEGDDGRRIIVKGRVEKKMVLVEETELQQTYRERMTTSVVSLDLDTGEFDNIV